MHMQGAWRQSGRGRGLAGGLSPRTLSTARGERKTRQASEARAAATNSPPSSLAAHLPTLSGPQAQIVCGACTTLLSYPQGAQHVRCARCGHVTPAAGGGPQAGPPPPGSGGGGGAGGGRHQLPPPPDMAQLVCSSPACRVVLVYPRGAARVQCGVCGCVSDAAAANGVAHLVCAGCHITLVHAHGAASVQCAVCHTVTATAAGAVTGGGGGGGGGGGR